MVQWAHENKETEIGSYLGEPQSTQNPERTRCSAGYEILSGSRFSIKKVTTTYGKETRQRLG